jgi:hypothetical protein
MQTILRSAKKELTINTGGPVVIIGEKINPTGHKKMAAALQQNPTASVIGLRSAVWRRHPGCEREAAGVDDIAMPRSVSGFRCADVPLPGLQPSCSSWFAVTTGKTL